MIAWLRREKKLVAVWTRGKTAVFQKHRALLSSGRLRGGKEGG
jgi:hypothetical protein